MGSSRVNIGNAAPSRKKAKKPKKMMRGGRVGMDTGKRNMSGRSTPEPVRGEEPVKRMRGGPAKKSGVMKRMRGGPVKK